MVAETYNSIEYPGYKIDRIPTLLEADMFQALGRSLYGKYEDKGFQVFMFCLIIIMVWIGSLARE